MVPCGAPCNGGRRPHRAAAPPSSLGPQRCRQAVTCCFLRPPGLGPQNLAQPFGRDRAGERNGGLGAGGRNRGRADIGRKRHVGAELANVTAAQSVEGAHKELASQQEGTRVSPVGPGLDCSDAGHGRCQTDANQSQFRQMRLISVGPERPPLGESGGTGLLVDWAAWEASFRVEKVVDFRSGRRRTFVSRVGAGSGAWLFPAFGRAGVSSRPGCSPSAP